MELFKTIVVLFTYFLCVRSILFLIHHIRERVSLSKKYKNEQILLQ